MKRPRAAGIMARAGAVPFWGLLGAVLAIPLLAGPVLAQQTSARPNILVFVSDDMGWGQPGFNGGTEVETPNMDRLADEGVKLTQFYVQPVCAPTRASLLTGRYAWKTGMAVNPDSRKDDGLLLDERTIAEALRESSYATWLVGKWHAGYWGSERLPLQRGFDHHYGFYDGFIDSYKLVRPWRGWHEILDWHRNGRPVVESGYSTFLLAEEASQLIERHDGSRPFFLYVAFNAPHDPYQAPPEYIAQFSHLPYDLETRKQRAMVKAMDDAIEQVMDALERRGVLDETLVMFLNDNGGESEAGGNSPYRGLKRSYLEGGIRVPAVMRWPSRITAGSASDALMHVADLFPTFAGLAGADTGGGLPLDGLDVWEAIANGAESPREEVVHSLDVIRVGDWKLLEEDGEFANGKSSPLQLYNIAEDPYETTNLASSETARVAALRERLVYHRPFARDAEPGAPIPGLDSIDSTDDRPVMFGEEENTAFGTAIQTALTQREAGNLGPALLRLEASGTSLKLIYNETLDAASVPHADAFTVVVNPGYRAAEVVGVELSGSEVVLTLAEAVADGNTVGLTYEVLDTGAIQDTDSLEAVGITWVTATVSITDDDFTVSFEQASYFVAEGDSVAIKVSLSAGQQDSLTIPLTTTNQDGASNSDYSDVPNPTIIAGDTEASFTFSATQDTIDDDGEKVKLGFGALPTGLTASGTTEATVSITDDDASPVITTNTASPILVEENETAVATLAATDADRPVQDLTWQITAGADQNRFRLTVDGVLTFGVAQDYEAPGDSDSDGDYEVTVEVSDGANPVEAMFTIRLEDVDDTAPMLSSASVTGTTLTLTYDEALDGSSTPVPGDFTVSGGDRVRAVTAVRVNGSAVELTLDVGGEHEEAGIQVSYTPGANPIQDVLGNDAEALSREAVTNETPDTTSPTVSSVEIPSTPPDNRDTYAIGDVIEATVTFDETVVVTRTPRMRLRVGSRNRTAGYLRGSGAAALVFSYEVALGDEDTDGVSIAAGRIDLNGGTIKDEADNDAVLDHEAVAPQAGHKVDGVNPALSSASVNGAALTLTYGEALDEGSRPAPGDFTVQVDGSGRSVSGVSVSGRVVTLTLASVVAHDETVTVSYSPGANPIRDAAGNGAIGLSNEPVANETPETALPNMWLNPTKSDPVASVRSEATYTVTFQGAWNTTVTAGGVPSGGHFTTLIGGVHNAEVTFLKEGGMATAGVEIMAELGGTGTLTNEVRAAEPNALSVLQGSAGNIGPTGSSTINMVTLTTDHPRVTLLSMVAPSPDWFVGVSGLSLLDAGADWLSSQTVNLYPWDAGTEEGTEFSLTNSATSPQEIITSLRGIGKFSNERIATLTFTRQSVNTAPSFTGDTRFEADENQTAAGRVAAADPDSGDGVTYAITGGADASKFGIGETTGVLTFQVPPNYERAADVASADPVNGAGNNEYIVTVTATGGTGDRAMTTEQTITATVRNVEEAGTISFSQVGSAIRARLSDPDGGVNGATWQWARSSNRNTGWTHIGGATSARYTPSSGDQGMYLQATVSYDDAHSSGKQAQGISATQIAPPNLRVATLVSGLSIPWDIAFTPDGTMLFTQRAGVLSSRLADGTVQTIDADFGDLFASGETGLMGIVVDPAFVSNRRFYTCQGHTGPEIQVIAWTLNAAYTQATRVADPLVGGLPASSDRHGGCRLRFGPEGYLWIATGDAASGTLPQDLTSLGGKVLRVDASTGAGAPTNPFAPSRVYTYGHRNVQGLALRPGTSQMWSVEHGPSVDDEINRLVAGRNYGWNPVPGYNESVPMTDLVEYPDAVEAKWSSGSTTRATSGGIFLEGNQWGVWEGRLAVATLADSKLRLFEFTPDGAFVSQLIVPELNGVFGRLRTPMMGPDGALYVSTSNGGSSDRILRIAEDDPIPVTLKLTPASIGENGGVSTVTASQNRVSITATTVTVSAMAVNPAVPGDVRLSVNKTLTITAGQTSSSGTVTLTANNNTADTPNKTVRVSGTATNSAGVTGPSDVTLTIIDDDDPPTVTLDLMPTSIGENGGSTTVTARLNRTSSETTTVTVSATAVSPAVAGDFALSAHKTLTLTAGQTTSAGTVTITANNNDADTPNKTVRVHGTADNSHGVTVPDDEELTITDDDDPPTVTLRLSRTSISENGGSTTVTARLDRVSSETTTVNVSATAVSPAVAEDLTVSVNKTLTILEGQKNSTGTVTITANNNDADTPNKTVRVHGTADNSHGVTVPDDEELTITDDDAAPVMTLEVNPTVIAEAAGNSTVTVRINNGVAFAEDQQIALTFTGTASKGTDYTVGLERLTLIAGQSSTATTVTAVDDALDDEAETVRITARHRGGVLGAEQTITITDDDASPVILTNSTILVDENETAVATLTASDADRPAEDLTWRITGGADRNRFRLTSDGVLTFAAAQDYEVPGDSDGNGDYEVAVEVHDGANPVEAVFTIRLKDVDDTAPVLSSASVNGASLTLTYGEALDPNSRPAASDFTVAGGNSARTVSNVAVSGRAVTLTLDPAVEHGETGIRVSYTPGTRPIQDAAGNDALGLSNERVTNNTGDTTAPTVSRVETTSRPERAATYAAGQEIAVTVTFSETVVVTGTPRLRLNVGGVSRTAAYRSGTGAAAVFVYVVADGESDTDGVSIEANSLTLNGGRIRDGANNNALLTHDGLAVNAGHKVDGVKPALAANGGAVVNGTTLTLTFGERLDGSSTPQASAFTVTGGDTSRTVTDVALSGSAVLLTVDPAVEHGETGIRVSYTVPTGTGSIPLQDVLGNDADRLSNVPVTNETPDTTSPTVSKLEITSDPGTDRTYAAGDEIRMTVTFSEPADVERTPRLMLKVGDRNRPAGYLEGTGTTELVFGYEVADRDEDTDGVSVEAGRLTLNGGTIRDGSNNNAVLDHDGLAANSGHKVDGAGPDLAETGGAVVDGTRLTLTYDEALDGGSRPVSGDFTVSGGDRARAVTGVRVNGSAVELTLDVGAEHGETGIQVSYTPGANPIQDVPGNDAEALSREPVTNDTPDTTSPTVSSLAITSNPGGDQIYAAEDEIEVTVTFSETVVVTRTPRMRLRVGSRNRTAGYLRGSGAAALVFSYEVALGDEDTDGVSIAAGRIDRNGGTIKDEADNDAVLDHEAVAPQAGHKVDGVRPAFLSAAVDDSSLTLTYGEALDGGSRPGTGDFTVEVGGTGRTVSGVLVSGRVVTLTLNPAVEHGDTGIRVSYSPGTQPIQDAVGNNALGLSSQSVTNTTGAPNTAPEITSPSSFDVPENQTLVRRLAARDDDPGDEVTGWEIVGGADRFQFSVAPTLES